MPESAAEIIVRRRERALVLAAKADLQHRERLVVEFRPAVASVARLYRGSERVGRMELMQAGTCGLLRALERYDATRETPFWAYASWWVRQAMQQLVAELTGPVVLSDRALRQLARIRAAQREHLQAHGRDPSWRELADEAGLGVEQVLPLVAATRVARSLDAPLEGGSTPVGEQLEDPSGEDGIERVPQDVAAGRVPELLATLSARERAVISGRFGLAGPEQTLRALGDRLGVSAERVRQIECHALEKLHAAGTSDD
jgi:RNA polymerase sigma factor (sigma-70 family)